MAPISQLRRLVFGGRLFDTEGWSCSLHLDGPTVNGSIDAVTFKPALTAWFTAPNSLISAAAKLDYIKYNRVVPFILPNGKTSMRYQDDVTNEHQQMDMGTGAREIGPPQNSVAISLKTGVARGRAHMGRFYPPHGAIPLSSDGRLSASTASSIAVLAATLIRELNAVVAIESGSAVVVFSNLGQIVNNVQTVSVGRVVDTMRSRRTSLPEQPSEAPVNP